MTNWRRYSTGTGVGGCDIVTCTVCARGGIYYTYRQRRRIYIYITSMWGSLKLAPITYMGEYIYKCGFDVPYIT